MRVWLMLTAMALVLLVAIVACNGDKEPAPIWTPAPAQAPTQAPIQVPTRNLNCEWAQRDVAKAEAELLKCAARAGSSRECATYKVRGFERQLDWALRRVSAFCR